MIVNAVLESKCIDIVLASYNGALYIKEQIESIQLCDGYDKLINKIIISDDHSSDETQSIVESFNDEKINFQLNENVKGPVGNFGYALSLSSAPLVMFSDQDDIWCKNKLLKFYNNSLLLDRNKPGVVYSDLLLVDEKLRSLGKTFFTNEHIPFDWGKKVSNLFLQNVAPGCAMLINRECIDRVNPIQGSGIAMHDWWVLLFASLYSNVIVINEPLTKYRQHSNNVIGASVKGNWRGALNKIKISQHNFHKTVNQLAYFKSKLKNNEFDYISLNDKSRLEFFSTYRSQNIYKRFCAAMNPNRYKSTMLRDIVTRIFILIG